MYTLYLVSELSDQHGDSELRVDEPLHSCEHNHQHG